MLVVTPAPSARHPESHGNHRCFSIFFPDGHEAGAGFSSFTLPAAPCLQRFSVEPGTQKGASRGGGNTFWVQQCSQEGPVCSCSIGALGRPDVISAVLCQGAAVR